MIVKDPFIRFLDSQKKAKIYVCPFRGNSGDVLIRMGALEIAKDLSSNVVTDPQKADILLWPGGNPAMWRSNTDSWRRILEESPRSKFIIGPATFSNKYDDWMSVIKKYQTRFLAIFARDPDSMETLERTAGPLGISIGLSHDPALYLRGSLWIQRLKDACRKEYALIVLRDDHEAFKSKNSWLTLIHYFLPRALHYPIDRLVSFRRSQRRVKRISSSILVNGLPLWAEDIAKANFDYFIDVVRRAAEVHTDRLHTMIMSVLLGKPVYAYETAYRKLEAVYKHSMASIPGINVTFRSFP